MNRVLVMNTIRQRLLEPFPLAASLATVGACVGVSVAEKADMSPEILALFLPIAAIALTSGIIGRDVQNGSIHLLLARPITRSRFLASRIGGVLFTLALLGLVPWAISAGTALAFGAEVDLAFSSAKIFAAFLQAAWFSVLLSALSVVMPGHRDALVLVLLFLASGLLVETGARLHLEWLRSLALWIGRQAFGQVSLTGWDLGFWPWKSLLRYASNLVVTLAFGFWAFNRRELGYGRD